MSETNADQPAASSATDPPPTPTQTVPGQTVTPSTPTRNLTAPNPPNKRGRGRPKGTKVSLVALCPGGVGGVNKQTGNDVWDLDSGRRSRQIQEEESSFSGDDEDYSTDDTVEDKELDVDSDEEDPTCICDMQGNRVLPIQKMVKTINRNMCCRRCTVRETKLQLKEFFAFCDK